MAVELVMPRLSESMVEGTVVSWLVADGAHVQQGQEIAEIETDKATVPYEAPEAGVLRILVPEGTKLDLGEPIALIDDLSPLPADHSVAPPGIPVAGGGIVPGPRSPHQDPPTSSFEIVPEQHAHHTVHGSTGPPAPEANPQSQDASWSPAWGPQPAADGYDDDEGETTEFEAIDLTGVEPLPAPPQPAGRTMLSPLQASVPTAEPAVFAPLSARAADPAPQPAIPATPVQPVAATPEPAAAQPPSAGTPQPNATWPPTPASVVQPLAAAAQVQHPAPDPVPAPVAPESTAGTPPALPWVDPSFSPKSQADGESGRYSAAELITPPTLPPRPPELRPTKPLVADRVAASPVARRLADELGIELADLVGTGPEGRIVRADVEAAQAAGAARPPRAVESIPTAASERTPPLPVMPVPPLPTDGLAPQPEAEPEPLAADAPQPEAEPEPLGEPVAANAPEPEPNIAAAAEATPVVEATPEPSGDPVAAGAPEAEASPVLEPTPSDEPVAAEPITDDAPMPAAPDLFTPAEPVIAPVVTAPIAPVSPTDAEPIPEQAPPEDPAPPAPVPTADVEPESARESTPAPEPAPDQATVEPEPEPVIAESVVLPAAQPGRGKGEATVVELTRQQQTVARRMAESRATIPDFHTVVEVDAEPLTHLRAELIATRPDLAAPSVNDLLIKAIAIALRAFPTLNGAYRDGRVEQYPRVNVGFAVDAEGSLMVPVIHDADTLSVGQIAARTHELAEKSRDGSLRPPDIASATFTLSNLGMLGVDRFTAVITPGQAGILTAGRVAERPVVRDGKVVAGRTLTLTLTTDHRAVYGAEAARFLGRVRQLLEQPTGLLA